MKYQLTDAAVEDIREIVDYIRYVQKSPQNARLVAKRLKAQFSKLVEIPYLGHVREELSDDRALVISVTGLLVIYDPWLKPLTILRVVHGARAKLHVGFKTPIRYGLFRPHNAMHHTWRIIWSFHPLGRGAAP